MSNIKLKNEIGIEQIYTDITKIKLPTVDGGFQVFSEGEPAIITSDFSGPLMLDGNYDGTILEVTKNGTIDLDSTITLNKKLPLGITVDVKTFPTGTINIENTEVVDVAEYATAQIVAQDLLPENIKEGVTILGVTGTAPSESTTTDTYAKSLRARVANSTSIKYLFSGWTLNDFSFLSILDFSNITDMTGSFLNCKNLIAVPSFLNAHKITNMESIFSGCSSLKSVPLLDVSKVTDASGFCQGCSALIDVPKLNFAAITDATSMFMDCSSLKSISLNGFLPTTTVTNLFYGCTNLETVELPCFFNAFVTNNQNVFSKCYNLKTLKFLNITDIKTLNNYNLNDCYHFTGKIDATYNPNGLRDGIIRVPDEKVAALRKAAGWATYADQIIGLNDIQILRDVRADERNMLVGRTIKLYRFQTAPTNVSITSSDKRIVKVANIRKTKDKIDFNLDFTGKLGDATITVAVDGDQTAEYSFKATFSLPEFITWEVEPVEGATYGFTLNSNGYYESTNNGVNNSYALCKVIFNNPSTESDTVVLDCINYAESSHDYGILSNLDTTLTLSNNADSSTNVYKSFSGQSQATSQQVTYDIPSGDHYIYVKYRKDGSVNSNNDSLQFRIIESTDTMEVL